MNSDRSLFSTLDRRKSFTLKDIAEATGYPLSTLQGMARRHEIPGGFRAMPGRARKWRFRRADIEQWWARITNEPN